MVTIFITTSIIVMIFITVKYFFYSNVKLYL